MSTTDRAYPLGLTCQELEQRAWVEGDLKTHALLQLATGAVDPAADGSHGGGPSQRFILAVNRQLPLEID